MIHEPILITGVPRSGTSMVAGMLHRCGVFSGDTAKPNDWNKKGMYENKAIRNGLVKPFLQQRGFDRLMQYPIPSKLQAATITDPDWRELVLRKLKREGLQDDMLWFYKDCKIPMMWRLWVDAFPKANWLIVLRPHDQVIDSAMRCMNRAGKQRSYWEGWYEDHMDGLAQIETLNTNVQVVHSNHIVRGDMRRLKTAFESFGVEWNPDAVDFIDEGLYTL